MTDQKETLSELRQQWKNFHGLSNHQERGKQFEVWLNELFQAENKVPDENVTVIPYPVHPSSYTSRFR